MIRFFKQNGFDSSIVGISAQRILNKSASLMDASIQ